MRHRLQKCAARGAIVLLVLGLSASARAQSDPDAVKIAPTGFVSVTGVYRSTTVGGSSTFPVPSTNFGGIPFGNTIQGNIGEFRLTGADTRLGFTADVDFGRAKVHGLFLGDFVGNPATNAFVSGNSHTFRLFLGYADIRIGSVEFLGGQAWSWLTPNRRGLSSDPADIFDTLNIDPSAQVGLTWTRAAQVRFVHHLTPNFAWGVGVENRDQYVGTGEVIFPFAFNAALGSQADAGNTLSAPGRLPDLLAKVAFDRDFGMMNHVHAEAVGLYRFFETTAVDIGGFPSEFSSHTTTGQGASVATNVDLIQHVRVLGSYFVSDGGGRYLGGLGPDFVVVPIDISPTEFTISLSTVTSHSILGGAEFYGPNDVIAVYYGKDFFDSNAFPDVTSPLVTKPTIGFAGTNSPNSANTRIREFSVDLRHTFVSSPAKGAVQALLQFSLVRREPGFVATGAPDHADTRMFFASMRYILP